MPNEGWSANSAKVRQKLHTNFLYFSTPHPSVTHCHTFEYPLRKWS